MIREPKDDLQDMLHDILLMKKEDGCIAEEDLIVYMIEMMREIIDLRNRVDSIFKEQYSK